MGVVETLSKRNSLADPDKHVSNPQIKSYRYTLSITTINHALTEFRSKKETISVQSIKNI